MKRFAALLGCVLIGVVNAPAAPPSSRDIALPDDPSELKPSDLPGFAIAQQKCGICHSADYINLQPPGMTTQQWTAEVVKMQHTYGAPISDSEVGALGEYLGATYGGQPR